MNNNIVLRIKEFMEYKSLNSLTLAKELGYKSSEKLSRLFRDGNAKPSYDIIYDISNMFEINVDWLITGRGTMLCAEQRQQIPQSELQLASSADESIIYQMYKDKDGEVKELMETIGSLKEQIRQLKRGKGGSASDVPDSTHANAG